MRRTLLVAALIVLAAPTASSAQDTRIGLGLGLQNLSVFTDDDFGLLNLLTPQVYIPIDLGGSFIIEPGVGYTRVHQESESEFGDLKMTFSLLRLGAGLLYVHAEPERGRLYVGPRIGILRLSDETEFGDEEDETSRTDLILAAVIGGEFFLVPAFSLGGEVGLNYVRLGDEEDEPDGVDSSASMVNIGTELRVRWYMR